MRRIKIKYIVAFIVLILAVGALIHYGADGNEPYYINIDNPEMVENNSTRELSIQVYVGGYYGTPINNMYKNTSIAYYNSHKERIDQYGPVELTVYNPVTTSKIIDESGYPPKYVVVNDCDFWDGRFAVRWVEYAVWNETESTYYTYEATGIDKLPVEYEC